MKKNILQKTQQILIGIFVVSTVIVLIMATLKMQNQFSYVFAKFYVFMLLLFLVLTLVAFIYNLVKYGKTLDIKKRGITFIKTFTLLFVFYCIIRFFKGDLKFLEAIIVSLIGSTISTFTDFLKFKEVK